MSCILFPFFLRLYPLNAEREPGFWICEGSGWLFVKAVAEEARTSFLFIHPPAAGGSSVARSASSVEHLAREENVRRPQSDKHFQEQSRLLLLGCC